MAWDDLPYRWNDEWIDDTALPEVDLRTSMADVARTNRWFGGTWAVWRELQPLIRARTGSLRLLDLAAGTADISRSVAASVRRTGRSAQVVALDKQPNICLLARDASAKEPDVCIVQGDAFCLPFPDKAFDAAWCALALHHFSRSDAIRVLRELDRVSAGNFVVTDLCRSRSTKVIIAVGMALIRATSVTRHDSQVSVDRAYTVRELRQMAEEAGLTRWNVRRQCLFRAVLESRGTERNI